MQYEVVPALRDAVEKRRKELGLGPGALAEAAGVTNEGLMPLRRGYRKQYQERLTAGVCRALGWTTDSIDRILAGGQPQLLDQPDSDRLDQVLAELADLRTRIERLEAGRGSGRPGRPTSVTDLTGRRAAQEPRYRKGADGPPDGQDES